MKNPHTSIRRLVSILAGVIAVVATATHASGQATWTTKASMPTPRLNHGVGVVDGIVYAVGGFNNPTGAQATVEAYNPFTDTWSTRASMATIRSGVGIGVIDGILYAVGGDSDAGNTAFLASVEAYMS